MSEKEISNPHMSREIVTEILSRLPVKSLLQFRSVSKQWRSIIDDGQFIRSHLNRSIVSSSNCKLLLPTFPLQSVNYMANASMELDCPFESEDAQISIVGSCIGLVCFLVDETDLIIYNLSTRHSKSLLAPPNRVCLFLIEFVYGFGCSSSPHDFKIVVLSRFARHRQMYPDLVRGQNDSSWHTRDLTRTFDFADGVSTFLNGSLHWLARRGNGAPKFIASLDVSQETFKEICLPPHVNYWPNYNLGELKGHLYVLCNNPSFTEEGEVIQEVDIWVMKEYGVDKSWMKFLRVPFDMGISYMVPLSFTKEGEVLLVVNLRDFIVAFDTKKKTFRKVMGCGGPSWPRNAVVYVESMVSPSGFESPRVRQEMQSGNWRACFHRVALNEERLKLM